MTAHASGPKIRLSVPRERLPTSQPYATRGARGLTRNVRSPLFAFLSAWHRRDVEYDAYNREERAACAHLFRLLHHDLGTDPERSPLAHVVRTLGPRVTIPGDSSGLPVQGAVVLAEVALIRDAYRRYRSDAARFMDALVGVVREQESTPDARLWSELPPPLSDPSRTHPRDIIRKGTELGLLMASEQKAYRAVRGMFNAKPDLALVLQNAIVVFEAKLTQAFDRTQLARTRNIAQVWATLLFRDLGFAVPPPYAVAKLGSAAAGVDLSWQELAELAALTYPPNDRTRVALEAAARLC